MRLAATRCTAIAGAGPAWTLRRNWPTAASPGFWLDPSTFANLYQDSAGTSPATAVEQYVGLELDKRLGLVLGVERKQDFVIGVGGVAALATYDTATGVGSVTRVDLSNQSFVRITGLTAAAGYRMSITNTGAATLAIRLTDYAGSAHAVIATGATVSLHFSGSANCVITATGGTVTFTLNSFKQLPGNHFSQASAPARPIISARVNLLTKTDQTNVSPWVFTNASGTATQSGNAYTFGAAAFDRIAIGGTSLASGNHTASVTLSGSGSVRLYVVGGDGSTGAPIDIVLTTAPTRYSVSRSIAGAGASGGLGIYNNAAAIAGASFTIHNAQLETGSAATRYQRVNTATDYDTAGFPQYLSFDALDDSISTGPTTFGGLLDVILAVRRTSVTGVFLFATAGGAQYLGAMDATAGATSSGAGTPTYLVNGVAVPGGTATTRAQLAAAVPVGGWCVFEAHNVDASAWTAMGLGAYTALPMGMGLAQGICCPAGNETTRARNRRFVGAKAGLAL